MAVGNVIDSGTTKLIHKSQLNFMFIEYLKIVVAFNSLPIYM